MALDISLNGDELEKKYTDLIRSNIPNYEEIWKRYIGNDGSANIVQITSLNTEEETKRKRFAQYHYTLLESTVCIKIIVDEITELKIDNIDNYLKSNNLFISFQAHAGRIRDCIKKLGEQCGKPNLFQKIDEFYKCRSQILHGCKIPFILLDSEYLIPQIKGIEDNPKKWDDTMDWKDIEVDDYQFIVDYLKGTYDELVGKLNGCLSELLSYVKTIVENKNIDYENFVSTITGVNISGFLENHCISATNCGLSACNE